MARGVVFLVESFSEVRLAAPFVGMQTMDQIHKPIITQVFVPNAADMHRHWQTYEVTDAWYEVCV